MKRLVFRISALVTVVALGAIAIVQAQRSTSAHQQIQAAPSPGSAGADPAAAPPAGTPSAGEAGGLTTLQPSAAEGDPSASAVTVRPLPTREVTLTAQRKTQAKPPAALPPSLADDVRLVSGEEPVSAEPLPPDESATGVQPPGTLPGDAGAAVVGDRYSTVSVAVGDPSAAAAPAGLPSGVEQPVLPLPSSTPRSIPASQESAAEAPVISAAGDVLPAGAEPPAFAGSEPPVGNPFQRPATMPSDSAEPRELAPLSAGSLASPLGQVPALGEGTGKPGGAELEGPQVPQLALRKEAPAEVTVGKPATFRITVHNTGKVPAHQVEVRDEVPAGMQLQNTQPTASRGARGEIVWQLGSLPPGEQITVEAEFIPVAEGVIGSVASVRFQADVSARTTSTRPELAVETTAAKEVLIGEPVKLSIKVTNPGTGVATGVVLVEQIPAGLRHPAGAELEYEVGTLKPGESRELDLEMTAARPGQVTNVLAVRGDGGLQAEDRLDIQVIAPDLQVDLEGPKRRYLEREAVYQVAISNPGTAAARNVELVAYLPTGLKFVSANNAGQFEPETRTVHWLLEELPANDTGTVQLVTLPIEAGEMKLRCRTSAEKGLSAEKEQALTVEGIAAILFELVDVEDPIEKGGETTYEIRVMNQGSKAATNVNLAVTLPPEMQPVAAEGPARYAVQNNTILFEPLQRLAPKADTTYRVRVQGLQPGDLRVRVQVKTDEMEAPVIKEESTRVYADE